MQGRLRGACGPAAGVTTHALNRAIVQECSLQKWCLEGYLGSGQFLGLLLQLLRGFRQQLVSLSLHANCTILSTTCLLLESMLQVDRHCPEYFTANLGMKQACACLSLAQATSPPWAHLTWVAHGLNLTSMHHSQHTESFAAPCCPSWRGPQRGRRASAACWHSALPAGPGCT